MIVIKGMFVITIHLILYENKDFQETRLQKKVNKDLNKDHKGGKTCILLT